MRSRAPILLLCPGVLAACASGSRALAYGLPEPPEATYAVGDTLAIEINALGQSLALAVNSTALYGLAFARSDEGVIVTLSVQDLQADVRMPMGAPMSIDEGAVAGDLVLSLDRTGDVTILESPVASEAASQFFAGPSVARAFFPGLPGTAVRAGDRWVDTVAYSEDAGASAERSITTYTVVGDVRVDGRALLAITFEGTSEMRQSMAVQGAAIRQETDLVVQGRLLWDLERGLMFERESLSTGTGNVRVAVAPMPLPTRVEIRSRARLRPR